MDRLPFAEIATIPLALRFISCFELIFISLPFLTSIIEPFALFNPWHHLDQVPVALCRRCHRSVQSLFPNRILYVPLPFFNGLFIQIFLKRFIPLYFRPYHGGMLRPIKQIGRQPHCLGGLGRHGILFHRGKCFGHFAASILTIPVSVGFLIESDLPAGAGAFPSRIWYFPPAYYRR